MVLLTEKNLKRFLEYHGIDAKIIEFKRDVMKSEDARQVVKDGIVVKSVVVMVDGNPVICILKGNDRIDMKKLKELENAKEVRLAKAKEVKALVGYDIGGVPPFGHLKRFKTIVDKEVAKLEEEVLFLGGGSHHHLLKIKGKILLDVLKNVVGSVEIESIREKMQFPK